MTAAHSPYFCDKINRMKNIRFVPAILIMLILSVPGYAAKKSSNKGTSAPVAVKGIIYDQETKETLTGVAVQLNVLDKKVYSEPDGSFTITLPESGTYKLKLHCISYKDKQVTIEAKDVKRGIVTFALEPVNP